MISEKKNPYSPHAFRSPNFAMDRALYWPHPADAYGFIIHSEKTTVLINSASFVVGSLIFIHAMKYSTWGSYWGKIRWTQIFDISLHYIHLYIVLGEEKY